ncbi:hypothetical protein F4677DRAFT_302698 [Hypoxylon crocopeplum]|nr:hypothetical protein F4677DRAFT_302698 [Hypoxylon crocopeplum]
MSHCATPLWALVLLLSVVLCGAKCRRIHSSYYTHMLLGLIFKGIVRQCFLLSNMSIWRSSKRSRYYMFGTLDIECTYTAAAGPRQVLPLHAEDVLEADPCRLRNSTRGWSDLL